MNEEVKEKVEEKETKKENKKEGKGLTILIIILLLLAIGGGVYLFLNKDDKEKQPEVKEEVKKYEEEVKIDASLATQPLTDAYISNLDNFNLKADYSNTDPAYTKLINKEVDLIVVTEPSAEELERAKEAGVELEVTPVVNEGFVFYTNKVNKVEGVTFDQLQKIYTGEITNWKELGGEDAKIVAYQRPVNSGSQTGILSLVMKGKKMKEPTKEEYVETMAGIIEVVADYDNGKDSIGYSYYYYATTMYGNDNLKFLAIDGVIPNHDTIKDSSYPLITAYNIVTLKGNDNETVKALKDTLLSSKGQEIARNAGYVELN